MTLALQVLALFALLPSTFYTLVFVVFSWMYDKGWYKWTAAALQVCVIAAWAAWVWWIYHV